MCCVCIIVLRLKGVICRGQFLRNMEREMEERASRQEQMLIKVLERLEAVLPDKKYSELDVKHEQESCCICFEDFTPESLSLIHI